MFDGADHGMEWPDRDRKGLRWVAEARKSAPGLDSLLTWAYQQGASRVHFQTGHPVWVSVHGQNHPVTKLPIDEIEFSHIVNHLYGADGMARLQGGTRLRYRLCDSDRSLDPAPLPPERHVHQDLPPRRR